MTAEVEEYGEKCARCGEVGEDRRTLWMACFYEMNELGVPFEQTRLNGVVLKQIGTKESTILGHKYESPVFEDLEKAKESQKESARNFYTLRVCKGCRAEWMRAIKEWFEKISKKQELGTGIFIREFGECIEITEEEFYRRKNSSSR